jgi:hypothetical protein
MGVILWVMGDLDEAIARYENGRRACQPPFPDGTWKIIYCLTGDHWTTLAALAGYAELLGQEDTPIWPSSSARS